MNLEVVAFIIGFFFAMNIGASGTAAAMGPAYGCGAIKTKKVAMLLVALFAFLGSLAGGEVVKTIGNGIIPNDIASVELTIIIIAAACLTLFIANLLGIPLSTSEVVVGSLVGAGIAFQALYLKTLVMIVSFWVIVPFVAFFLTFIVGKLIPKLELKYPGIKEKGKHHKWLVFLLIIAGSLEAFAAGMNNVANAVGPLVGAGLIEISTAVVVGGLFVSLGAVVLGGKVLETNGKKITQLSLTQGIVVSFTGGTLVIISSIFGLPVPLTQVTTSAIVGTGASKNGLKLIQKGIVKRIVMVWIVSPIFSLVMSYGLILLFLKADFYALSIIISVFLATVGSLRLIEFIKKENNTIHEQGGGI